MDDGSTPKTDKAKEMVDKLDPSCSCIQDPFSLLPPELRPKPQPKKGGLRQANCPVCGLKFWTNRETDFCIECGKKGLAKA
jgi:hypothetical protein